MKNPKLLSSKISEIEITYRSKVNHADLTKISCSRDCFELLQSVWSDKVQYCEEFYVLVLNKANRVLGVSKISEGGLSGTVVDPKRIFQVGLKSNASSIILAHNHPSGNLQPSEADIKITRKCFEAGALLDLPIIDHLIITADRYFSFADEGRL